MSLVLDLTAALDRLRENADLDADRLDALERFADTLPGEAVDEAIAAAQVRLPERGIHPSLHYLLVRLAARRDERDAAADILDRLLERLNQDGEYALLVEVARRNADWLPGERLIPLLVRAARAHEGALSDAVFEEMLARYPEDPRLRWLAGLRGLRVATVSAPPPPATLVHLARALPHLARAETAPVLEESALPVIERLDSETAPDVLAMLAVLVERHRIEEAKDYVELALDSLLAQGQAPLLWDLLRSALVRDPAAAAQLRPAALAALLPLRADLPRHAQIIADSGLADSQVAFDIALARYTRLMEFPPGGYVEHGSWGVGEIVAHDGENLTVRFPNGPEHVFKRSLADRALERRRPDDLNVLRALFPERLTQLRDEDPAGLVVIALRTLGGEGKPRDLKRLLSPGVVAAEAWSGWWRQARAVLQDDDRIDLTQSFRDAVLLAGHAMSPGGAGSGGSGGGGSGDVALPGLADRGDVARQLKLLRRFLGQHPHALERSARAYRRRLERWLDTRSLTGEERLLILILLADMDPAARPRLRDGIVEACRHGFSLATFSAESDQTMLFELGMEAEDWQPVAMAALDSRQLPLRQRALAAVEERLGAEALGLYRAVLEASPARGDAVMEVARAAVSGHSTAVAGQQTALAGQSTALARIPAVDIFIALLRLVSEPERETLRKQAQALLAADSPLCARLAAEPAGGPGAEQVALALLSFRASDSYLFPILETLERIWGPAVIEAFRRRRERETRRITARMEDEIGELPVGLMTRATFNALCEEIARVEYELRTTIPRAIQKARELGDLRESGEYESAKLKQRQASDRLVLLQRQVAEAQVIEDLPIDDSCVLAGTEVMLRPVEGGEPVTYWILGEGDSRHGPDVVSYRAELGRALWRRRPGEEIELPLPAGRRRFRVERLRRRLPAAEVL